MLPHFGEYVVLKLDPVASLRSLNDPVVLRACKILKNKTYIACAINLCSFPLPGAKYVSLTAALVSQGLPNSDLGRFILPDMSVPISPETCHPGDPLSRPPMKLSNPLPWPNCYHPTQATIKCRVQNDTNIGDPWPEPRYKMELATDRLRLDQYFREDANRRDALQLGQDVSFSGGIDAIGRTSPGGESDESRRSNDTFPVWFEEDIESECCRSADQGQSWTSCPASLGENAGSSQLSTTFRRCFPVSSFFRRLFAKVPRLSHSAAYPYDEDDDISAPSFDPVVNAGSIPVVIVSNDLKSVRKVNDPWDFFRELDALKRIEAEYYERVKAKTR
ncbi:hypothetical protein IW261DRAFT_718525 [Armillaria novae-zelandiae]|uniref:Uncharacterized protein n=1 Tax=Armillaria novae-zelandiae TaxID=153914 RepID=A0AA39NWD2_9AGAR|nr:hypothetical protein IW261DRAFT_718525 [Armillaria novae-zelandiae]